MMDDFKVTVRPHETFCGVLVHGLDNGRWLIDYLSRAFIFKSSEPLQEDANNGTSSFQVPYSSQVSLSLLRRILGGIPQVVLVMDQPPGARG